MSKLQAKNEAIIDAPIATVWSIITDITLLPKINPGVVKASGIMDRLQSTRTCEINNKGRKGTTTERLVELVPERKTAWSLENDTLGMSRMLKDVRFAFLLEKLSDSRTRVVNETYYDPANVIATIMNGLMMKKMISRTQEQILQNIRSLAENH
jgi:hypothetical protein